MGFNGCVLIFTVYLSAVAVVVVSISKKVGLLLLLMLPVCMTKPLPFQFNLGRRACLDSCLAV